LDQHYEFKNPPLPYAYNAMEPFIDTLTMELHHDRHLQTYIDNLNAILKDYPKYQHLTLTELLLDIASIPEAIQTPVSHNAGGAYNHIFFFEHLKNPSKKAPTGQLASLIIDQFGNFDTFKALFKQKALSLFGSGYVWLVLDAFANLQITATANQETPFLLNMFPLLNLDVWEHAYYLKNYNVRAAYIDNWFHIINWDLADQDLTNHLSALENWYE